MCAILKPRITRWQSIPSAHASYVPIDFLIGQMHDLRRLHTFNVRSRDSKRGGGTPEEMAQRIRADYERYVRIVKATGL